MRDHRARQDARAPFDKLRVTLAFTVTLALVLTVAFTVTLALMLTLVCDEWRV
jgi:hypothetical protein